MNRVHFRPSQLLLVPKNSDTLKSPLDSCQYATIYRIVLSKRVVLDIRLKYLVIMLRTQSVLATDFFIEKNGFAFLSQNKS